MRVIELFCGAGLLGHGFTSNGFKTIYAADLDKHAVASYNMNLKNKVAEVADVSKVKKGLKCEVILAGPPCQGFSTLGKRDKNDIRNKLSLVVYDWAVETEAKVIVVENVPQFLSSIYYKKLVKKFNLKGYYATTWVLNASEFGVAQHRKRSFTIFSKIGLPTSPKKSKKVINVKEAFKGLCKVNSGYDRLHTAPKLTELSHNRISRIPINGGKYDLMKSAKHLCPPSWYKLGRQASDVWGRMDFSKPANTIRCSFCSPSKGRYIHPTEDRMITLREAARLQGIPDSWSFVGERTVVARQIGNGVPVPLAKAVGKEIVRLFK